MRCPICGGDVRALGDGLYECLGPPTGSGYDIFHQQFAITAAAPEHRSRDDPPGTLRTAVTEPATASLGEAVAAARAQREAIAADSARAEDERALRLRACRAAFAEFMETMRARGYPGAAITPYKTGKRRRRLGGGFTYQQRKVKGWAVTPFAFGLPTGRGYFLSVDGVWFRPFETTSSPTGMTPMSDESLDHEMSVFGSEMIALLGHCLAAHT